MRRLHPHIYIVSAVPYMICIGNLVCRTRVHYDYSYEIFQTSVVMSGSSIDTLQPASSEHYVKIQYIIFSFVFFFEMAVYNDKDNNIYVHDEYNELCAARP